MGTCAFLCLETELYRRLHAVSITAVKRDLIKLRMICFFYSMFVAPQQGRNTCQVIEMSSRYVTILLLMTDILFVIVRTNRSQPARHRTGSRHRHSGYRQPAGQIPRRYSFGRDDIKRQPRGMFAATGAGGGNGRNIQPAKLNLKP